jgi:hypothetical protein
MQGYSVLQTQRIGERDMSPFEANRASLHLIRAARALAAGQGDPTAARAWISKSFGPNDASLEHVQRAFLGTGDVEPAGESARALANLVIEHSLIGRIEGVAQFQRVEFLWPLMTASDAAVADWVAEATPIPPLESGIAPFDIYRLEPRKIGALAVVSAELIRIAAPGIDRMIQRVIVNALTRKLNQSLFDGLAGDASRPASLVDHTIEGTGNPAQDISDALSTLPDSYADRIVLIAHPLDVPALLAARLAEPSTLNARQGGLLLGFPAVVSTAIPLHGIAWIVPDLILLASDGVQVGTSDQSTVAVSDGDDGVQLVSAWQENLSLLRAIHAVSWKKLEPAAAGLITDVVAPPVPPEPEPEPGD